MGASTAPHTMTQPPSPSPSESDEHVVPETELPSKDLPDGPTLQSSTESTIVTGSVDDDAWSLGPVPSMPGAPQGSPPVRRDLRNLSTGAVIGDFQVQRVLGTGAFATVYLALQVSLNRFVALKVTGDLGHEGRRMARLEHPNVVQVYAEQILASEKTRLLSMQYVPGTTLQQALSELTAAGGRPTWSGADLVRYLDYHTGAATELRPDDYAIRGQLESMDHQQVVCFLTAEVASGLQFAHSHDVLHRDIKPANILLNAVGRPLLVDFNLSEETTDGPGDQGLVGGTLAYMSPEHLKAFEYAKDAVIPVGPAADVYSLALVMVQMLTGQLPLPRSDSSRPAPPGGAVSIPRLRELRSRPYVVEFDQATASQRSLQAVVERATEPQAEQRTPSAEVLSRELRSCQRLRKIETAPVMQHPALQAAGRHPMLSFALLAVLPQVIASVVNIVYNVVRVPELSVPTPEAGQQLQDAFYTVTIGYNLVVWPVCLVLVATVLRRSIDAIRMLPCATEELEKAQRLKLVRLPVRMLMIASLGWAPGIIVFPLGIWLQAEVDPMEVFVHFSLNFATCALLAITWSYLGLAWLVASVGWQRHWLFPQRFDSQAVAEELGHFSKGLKQARFASSVVPLFSCMLVIAATGQDLSRLGPLLQLLIALGMVGPLAANRIAFRVSERLRIFAAD